MLELASKELGRFQGKIVQQSNHSLENLTNLSKLDFAKVNYLNYRNWPEVYDYIREKECPIPEHLCKMLIELDEHSEELWSEIEKLPIVLCHRDFWNTNVFYQEGKIRLIDWDTTGWGYLGEDIASLIADESDVTQMIHYYSKCIPAYHQLEETANVMLPENNFIWENDVVSIWLSSGRIIQIRRRKRRAGYANRSITETNLSNEIHAKVGSAVE